MAYFRAGSKEDEIIEGKLSEDGSYKIEEEENKASRIEFKDAQDEDFSEEGIGEYEEEEDEYEEDFNEDNMNKENLRENKKMFNPTSRKFKKAFGLILLIVVIVGGISLYKLNDLGRKVTGGKGSLFDLITGSNEVEAMENGQINILLIGVRGRNIPGGSLLADTIMVASFRPSENKVALISIPRDLYVPIPGKGYSRKINEANPIGEEEGPGKGLELMKETVSQVTGLPIHYAASANFNAFRETVDVLGGVTVHLDKPFSEKDQFVEGNECGGVFELPAGDVTLNGEKALCYSRARYNSSDFDRARRQQEVLMAIKSKALSVGTLTDFSKLKDMLDVVGSNIRTDMDLGEIKELYSLFKGMEDPKMYREVLDTSSDGLLYSTTADNGAYIILPKGDNFDNIHEVSANIFNENEEELQESQ